jgi:hypothetical protein
LPVPDDEHDPATCAARTRRAFVVGLAGARGDGTAEPSLTELLRPPLTYAPHDAQQLRAQLAAYGYALSSEGGDEAASADQVEGALLGALTGPGTVVVSVLAHGYVHPRTKKLHIIGNDGMPSGTHVESWLELVEGAEDGRRPTVLFVSDICYAAGPAKAPWQRELDPSRRATWALAACDENSLAYDGRLTRAFTEVLRLFAADELRTDDSLCHIPLDRFCREVNRLVTQYAKGSAPQAIFTTEVGLHVEVDRLDFFPNPRYAKRPVSPRNRVLDAALASFPADRGDLEHFVSGGAGGDGTSGPAFHGRTAQLAELADWLAGEGACLKIVTGKPGAGKSSLISVLVCAAHEMLREPAAALWSTLAATAPAVPNLAVIHARRREVPEIVLSLARQWHLADPSSTETWVPDELVDALRTGFPHGPPTLVLDALDESNRPDDVMATLLLPLLTTIRDDGRPVCRVLIGSRPARLPTALSNVAYSEVDLDRVSPAELREDLAGYVKDLLRSSPTYSRRGNAHVTAVLVESMVDALVGGADVPDDVLAPLPWGEFLVASLYCRALLGQPAARSMERARALGAAVPRDLRTLLELDLANRPAARYTGPVLSAVAFAEGAGMPEQLVQAAARAFADPAPALADVRAALDAARFYLHTEVGPDGSTLYRLFHQGLVDQLRDEPLRLAESSMSETGGNRR